MGFCNHLFPYRSRFFQRKQQEGESIREYLHALVSLMKAMKHNSRCIIDSDALVHNQFIECVQDGLLQQELRRSVRLNPELSFLSICSEAIRWVEVGVHVGVSRMQAYSCDFQASVVGECHADSHAIMVKSSDELSELKECLRN